MALKKRGKTWHLRIRPFGGKEIWVSTGSPVKSEAESVEQQIKIACQAQNYGFLDPTARAACLQMFRNQRWEIPADLAGQEATTEELTLWKGMEYCLRDPEVRDSSNRERMEQAFVHLVRKWGRERTVRDIRVSDIKLYQTDRLKEGAAASTINKERAALSRMFQVLMELELVERNPVKEARRPSERDGEREVYISFEDFNGLVANLPTWEQPIIKTLYLTGMRRGECLGFCWGNVDLESRIIKLSADQTKEQRKKRVPIHRLLIPVLERVGKLRSINSERVFIGDSGQPPSEDSLRKPWKKALQAVGLDTGITIHDLRHVWSTNAMRSGVDSRISESIMGHALRQKDVPARYIAFNDHDLVRAIDRMSFDHGKTEVWLARQAKENPAVRATGNHASKTRAQSTVLKKRSLSVNR